MTLLSLINDILFVFVLLVLHAKTSELLFYNHADTRWHLVSLEAFKNKLQALCKKVNENESALKTILNERAEKPNWADDQNLVR